MKGDYATGRERTPRVTHGGNSLGAHHLCEARLGALAIAGLTAMINIKAPASLSIKKPEISPKRSVGINLLKTLMVTDSEEEERFIVASTLSWTDQAAGRLLRQRSDTGGWGYVREGRPAVEPTAFAALALHCANASMNPRGREEVLIVGTNAVATDATATRLIGGDPEEVAYLAVASSRLGPIREHHIEQRGEPIARLATRFQFPQTGETPTQFSLDS
jgi:hypothetical protein